MTKTKTNLIQPLLDFVAGRELEARAQEIVDVLRAPRASAEVLLDTLRRLRIDQVLAQRVAETMLEELERSRK